MFVNVFGALSYLDSHGCSGIFGVKVKTEPTAITSGTASSSGALEKKKWNQMGTQGYSWLKQFLQLDINTTLNFKRKKLKQMPL